MKPRFQNSKVNFDSYAPKGAMGHTEEKQSLQSKFAVIYIKGFETWCFVGHKHWVRVPKKNYFPLACHISWGLLILQCLLLHSKQSQQAEKLRDTEGSKTVHNKAFISYFPPKLWNETHWVAAAHIQKSYYASQSHPNSMNNWKLQK